jgi:hypothetical protein
MAYTPDPTNALQPTDDVKASTAAAEFRALKAYLAQLAGLTPAMNGIVSINGGQLAGLRNRIINGDMRVAQRGTSGTLSLGYIVDRWLINTSGAAPTWSSSVSTPMGPYQYTSTLAVTGIAGNTGVNLIQRIESVNSRDLAGQTVTVSYYAYQSTGSSMNVTTALSYPNVADTFTAQTLIGTSSGTVVPSGVFTKVTASFSVPNAAVTGLQVSCFQNTPPLLGGQVMGLANVQLELGSVATQFEMRPIGMELAMCQRYYEVVSHTLSSGAYAASVTVAQWIQFAVPKRIVPTLVRITNGATTNCSGGTSDLPSTNGFRTYVTSNAAGGCVLQGEVMSAVAEL